MNDVSRNKKWNALLRIFGFVAALMGMYISAQFSVAGFEFSLSSAAWIGWAIALIIVVLESVWQKFGNNRTLFVIAVGCYAYGVITNVVGIVQAKGGYDQVNWLDYAVALFFGVLFEVFPEPLLAWAISGDTSSDPLGALLDGVDEPKKVARPLNNKIADVLPKRIQYQPSRPNPAMKPGSKTVQTQQKPQPVFRNDPKPWPPQSSYLKVIEEEE